MHPKPTWLPLSGLASLLGIVSVMVSSPVQASEPDLNFSLEPQPSVSPSDSQPDSATEVGKGNTAIAIPPTTPSSVPRPTPSLSNSLASGDTATPPVATPQPLPAPMPSGSTVAPSQPNPDQTPPGVSLNFEPLDRGVATTPSPSASRPTPPLPAVPDRLTEVQPVAPDPSPSPASGQGLRFGSESAAAAGVASLPAEWWSKGSDSPLAVAIGAAEGTRQPDGSKNPAYYWHVDPGNGADNFGTFSYQHLPPQAKAEVQAARNTAEKRQIAAQQKLPELADQRQLEKLRRFYEQLRQQAIAKGITLSHEELINGLDLANQSEAAALSSWGFIDRLAQMRQLITDPEEQLKEARTWSYWCPEKNRWDAPGLGNNYDDIRQDQERRQSEIRRALSRQTPEILIAQAPNANQIEAQADRIIRW